MVKSKGVVQAGAIDREGRPSYSAAPKTQMASEGAAWADWSGRHSAQSADRPSGTSPETQQPAQQQQKLGA